MKSLPLTTRPALILLVLCTVLMPAKVYAEPFRFVVLPDTQIYSWDRYPKPATEDSSGNNVSDPDGTFSYFMDQTEWLARNAEAMGVSHVIHLGDIVQNANNIPEWERARSAMDLLDENGISYGIAVGSHDISGDDYSNYLHYFGPQYYQHHDWYGSSPSGKSNYQIIEHESADFIFINVAMSTPEVEVNWAIDLLNQHHDKLAIISTHSYLWDYRFGYARNGEKVKKGILFGQTLNDADFSQQDFYESLIAKHPNVLMVMAGHVHGSLTRTDGRNGANLPVLEVLADYQDGRNGGEGYLRIYELDIENNKFSGHTYSPSTDRYRTIFEEFVDSIKSINDHAFSDRFPRFLAEIVMSRLRQDIVPDVNVVTNHPEYLANPDYYEQQLADLFGGIVPPHIGSLGEWEALWMLTYANNRKDPLDYSENLRRPQLEFDVDYKAYLEGEIVKPNPIKAALQRLVDAINGFGSFLEDVAIILGTYYKS